MRDVGHVIDVIGGGDNRFFHLLLHLRVIAFSALKMARTPIPSKNQNLIYEYYYSQFNLFLSYLFLRLSCDEAGVTTNLEDTQTATDVLHFRRHLLTHKIEFSVFNTTPVSKPCFHLQ